MSPDFHQPQSKAEADPRRWLAMAVLLLASFMNLIDVTIVNVALASMQSGMGATSSQIEWVVAAYILAFALGLLPFGRLGDILGRTHMFLVGVAAFTAASALCGFAPSIEWLIAARVLQGFAGAMMAPQVLAIATVTFPPEERGQAFALFGLSSGLAAVAGPIVGGLLIGGNFLGLEWRPIFLVNVPVGILALVLGWFLIPRPPGHPGLRNDYVGIGLFSAAMVALVYPLIEGRAFGWPAWCWGLMLAALVLLVIFVLWEKRMAALGGPQLLNFSLLTNGQFLLGMLTTVIFASGIPPFFMIFSLMLQTGFGFTPLESGLTNTPFSVGVLLTSLIIGRFGSAFLRARLAAGALLLAGGMLWTHVLISGLGDTVNHWDFLPPLFVAGVGLGLAISALFQTILAGVPGRDAGAGSGALQAMQQVGGAVGIALVGELFFTSLEGARSAGAQSVQQAFGWAASHATWYEVASFAAVVVLAIFFKSRSTPRVRTDSPSTPAVAEA